MEKKWYVVHTYSGYEHKAKAALEERVKALGKSEEFGEVLVPAEKVVELVKGRKKTSSRKFFPGYMLVNMALNDETWHVVKSTPKVTGFVGDARNPSPISENEVRDITQQMAEGAARPKPKVQFEAGESVKVIDGPFQDFNGVVEDVKADKGKLRVLISIFGRATPVELDFVQVERA
jgi:transcriptional antiterminator NusG